MVDGISGNPPINPIHPLGAQPPLPSSFQEPWVALEAQLTSWESLPADQLALCISGASQTLYNFVYMGAANSVWGSQNPTELQNLINGLNTLLGSGHAAKDLTAFVTVLKANQPSITFCAQDCQSYLHAMRDSLNYRVILYNEDIEDHAAGGRVPIPSWVEENFTAFSSVIHIFANGCDDSGVNSILPSGEWITRSGINIPVDVVQQLNDIYDPTINAKTGAPNGSMDYFLYYDVSHNSASQTAFETAVLNPTNTIEQQLQFWNVWPSS